MDPTARVAHTRVTPDQLNTDQLHFEASPQERRDTLDTLRVVYTHKSDAEEFLQDQDPGGNSTRELEARGLDKETIYDQASRTESWTVQELTEIYTTLEAEFGGDNFFDLRQGELLRELIKNGINTSSNIRSFSQIIKREQAALREGFKLEPALIREIGHQIRVADSLSLKTGKFHWQKHGKGEAGKTDFGRWVLSAEDTGEIPNFESGTLNCWEAPLLCALEHGLITKAEIKDLYERTERNEPLPDDDMGLTVQGEQIDHFFNDRLRAGERYRNTLRGVEEREGMMPLKGDLVLFGEATGHVMIGLVAEAGERPVVLSLWAIPRDEAGSGQLMQLPLERLMSEGGEGRVNFFRPKWEAPN